MADISNKRYEVEYDGQLYYYIRNTVSNSYYSKDFGVPMRFVHEDTARKYVDELNAAISIRNTLSAPTVSES